MKPSKDSIQKQTHTRTPLRHNTNMYTKQHSSTNNTYFFHSFGTLSRRLNRHLSLQHYSRIRTGIWQVRILVKLFRVYRKLNPKCCKHWIFFYDVLHWQNGHLCMISTDQNRTHNSTQYMANQSVMAAKSFSSLRCGAVCVCITDDHARDYGYGSVFVFDSAVVNFYFVFFSLVCICCCCCFFLLLIVFYAFVRIFMEKW